MIRNLFICQTSFQLFYAQQLIGFLVNSQCAPIKFIIIHSNLKLEKVLFPDNVELINAQLDATYYLRFRRFREILKVINGNYNEAYTTNFFIPHKGGLFSNYIFYNAQFVKDNNTTVNLYYEGILYFYDYEEDFRTYHVKRFVAAFLLGFNYRFQKSILPYQSKKVHKIYTPLPEFTKGPKQKLVYVPFEKSETECEVIDNRFLILGGPVEYLSEYYHLSIKRIMDLNLDNAVIYYKGHGSFNTHNKGYKSVFKEVINFYGIAYIELCSKSSIEFILKDINPKKIFSYYSSALLNIKLIYGNNFDLICFFHSQQEMGIEIKKVFEYFNIQIITID